MTGPQKIQEKGRKKKTHLLLPPRAPNDRSNPRQHLQTLPLAHAAATFDLHGLLHALLVVLDRFLDVRLQAPGVLALHGAFEVVQLAGVVDVDDDEAVLEKNCDAVAGNFGCGVAVAVAFGVLG